MRLFAGAVVPLTLYREPFLQTGNLTNSIKNFSNASVHFQRRLLTQSLHHYFRIHHRSHLLPASLFVNSLDLTSPRMSPQCLDMTNPLSVAYHFNYSECLNKKRPS